MSTTLEATASLPFPSQAFWGATVVCRGSFEMIWTMFCAPAHYGLVAEVRSAFLAWKASQCFFTISSMTT